MIVISFRLIEGQPLQGEAARRPAGATDRSAGCHRYSSAGSLFQRPPELGHLFGSLEFPSPRFRAQFGSLPVPSGEWVGSARPGALRTSRGLGKLIEGPSTLPPAAGQTSPAGTRLTSHHLFPESIGGGWIWEHKRGALISLDWTGNCSFGRRSAWPRSDAIRGQSDPALGPPQTIARPGRMIAGGLFCIGQPVGCLLSEFARPQPQKLAAKYPSRTVSSEISSPLWRRFRLAIPTSSPADEWMGRGPELEPRTKLILGALVEAKNRHNFNWRAQIGTPAGALSRPGTHPANWSAARFGPSSVRPQQAGFRYWDRF